MYDGNEIYGPADGTRATCERGATRASYATSTWIDLRAFPPLRHSSAQRQSHATVIERAILDQEVASGLDSFQLDESR